MKMSLLCALFVILNPVLLHAEGLYVGGESSGNVAVKPGPETIVHGVQPPHLEADEPATILSEADGELKAEDFSADLPQDIEGFGKNLASLPESASELDLDVQTTSKHSSQPNTTGMIYGIHIRRTITIKVKNQMTMDTIKVKCQGLKDNRLIKDFSVILIGPISGYTWRVHQVDYSPNSVKCFFRRGGSHMIYTLYRDSELARVNTIWLVDGLGLYGYITQMGYVILQLWKDKALSG